MASVSLNGTAPEIVASQKSAVAAEKDLKGRDAKSTREHAKTDARNMLGNV